MTGGRESVIRIEGVTKRLGGQQVLEGVDLSIGSGETVVIIGRSGCGKSVLLKHIIGLLIPDGGRVLVDGENVGAMERADLFRTRRRFGFVFQGAALFDSMTIAENVTVLHEGKVLAEGKMEQVQKDPRVIEVYLGT